MTSKAEPACHYEGTARRTGSLETRRSRVRSGLILLCVWTIAAYYTAAHLKRGWVPHDEGTFAQSADRVLHGELPHRDYTEVYTGGLTYLNASAFKYLGENLATLRFVLFAFFVVWVPVFYWIAHRLASDWAAGAATLLAVAWSIPNYTAAVPSWYCLFFATFGLAALLAYTDNRAARWLFVAGLCGGLSFLVKSTGLFYIAAAQLFFLFSEQGTRRSGIQSAKVRSIFYTLFVSFSILIFVSLLVRLVRPLLIPRELVEFVIPPAALATVILMREQTSRARTDRERFLSLLHLWDPFAAGLFAPLLVFLIPFVRGGALHALVNGLFVLPFRRLAGSTMLPPPMITTLPALTLLLIVALGTYLHKTSRWLWWLFCFTVASLVAHCLVSSRTDRVQYAIAWSAAYWVIPVVTIVGSCLLCRVSRYETPPNDFKSQEQLFAILTVAALCALVQFPFSGPIYFCYVAPLGILAVLAVSAFAIPVPKPLLAIVCAGFLAFAVVRVTPSFIYAMGSNYQKDSETSVLDLPRAGKLRIEMDDVATYTRLISLIHEHAGAGQLYAGPDASQIYFLANYKNLTPVIFELFEEDTSGAPILRLVDTQPVRVIVLNSQPSFTPRLSDDLHNELLKRFPDGDFVGNFEVRWRK